MNIGEYRYWLFYYEIYNINIYKLYIPSFSRNNTKYEDGDIIEDVEFCAGRPDMNGNGKTQKGADTCQGDSIVNSFIQFQ